MASIQTHAAPKQLTLFGFFAITASMVMAVYEYPTFATSGFSLIFFLLLGGLLWFIPVGLCAAEMATVDGWQEGGVFTWVSKTLGEKWGFAAISFGYLQIAIGFIPMLYFVLGALSYILKWPELNQDPVVKSIVGLIILWGLAFTQFGGTKNTARIAKIGFFAGILLPAAILVVLSVSYLHSGAPIAIKMDEATFFPNVTQVGTLVVFVAFILSYMGVEASATHVNEMKNPGRDYPLAMLLLMVAAIALSSIGGLAIAAVIPRAEINLSAGVMQTFTVLINHFGPGFEWAIRGIAALLLLGVLAEISAWIVGPSRGMLVTAQKGILPARFARMNKNGVPVALVISQLVITSIALVVLTNTGGGNNMSFLIALALTVVIYLCSYIMLFMGYIQLIRKQPQNKRSFNIPGGNRVKVTVALIGLISSIVAFVVSFFPPTGLPGGDANDIYTGVLVVSFLIVLAIPFIIYATHDKRNAVAGLTLEPLTKASAPEGHFFIHPRAAATHHVVVKGRKID